MSTINPVSPTQPTIYTIKAGDTLSQIAKANHTTVEELMALNDIKDPNRIDAGATLQLARIGVSQPNAPVPSQSSSVQAPSAKLNIDVSLVNKNCEQYLSEYRHLFDGGSATVESVQASYQKLTTLLATARLVEPKSTYVTKLESAQAYLLLVMAAKAEGSEQIDLYQQALSASKKASDKDPNSKINNWNIALNFLVNVREGDLKNQVMSTFFDSALVAQFNATPTTRYYIKSIPPLERLAMAVQSLPANTFTKGDWGDFEAALSTKLTGSLLATTCQAIEAKIAELQPAETVSQL